MSGGTHDGQGMDGPAKTVRYTVVVVSDHSQAVRKYSIPRWCVRLVGVVAGGAAILGLLVGVYCFSLVRTRAENHVLAEENSQLRTQIASVRARVGQISSTLDRVERFDSKLRTAVTQLQDPERNLAIGPVGAPDEAGPGSGRAEQGKKRSLDGGLDSLDGEATRQESTLREMQQYFDEQRSLLASTPSVWPTRGWVTSDFGVRLDPYTAERMMHRGLDIATPFGQAIYSPSDGTVVFAGAEPGYGKVLVVDHGFGVRTRYAHLSEVFVKLGERVSRGARVAAVGNTGRSTGPHLHYEVRINGIPENPRKFILE
jgi:murein DD-endopeptidase MepM/ murein hydrolase activator NlpD